MRFDFLPLVHFNIESFVYQVHPSNPAQYQLPYDQVEAVANQHADTSQEPQAKPSLIKMPFVTCSSVTFATDSSYGAPPALRSYQPSDLQSYEKTEDDSYAEIDGHSYAIASNAYTDHSGYGQPRKLSFTQGRGLPIVFDSMTTNRLIVVYRFVHVQ